MHEKHSIDSEIPRVEFAIRLEEFGESIAVITESGDSLSYRALAEKADEFGRRLTPPRRVLMIHGANALEPLCAYLGALRAGWPVILAGVEGQDRLDEIFAPHAHFRHSENGWRLDINDRAPVAIHSELAILLSTSGTTGAAKLVRISSQSADANAKSISEYLNISHTDRAITSLPLHYSYGLSVVNSHLSVGATILLTDRSVIDPNFWEFFRHNNGTSISGVPHTYNLLDRIGFRENFPPSLRTLTQAGGRLRPDLVKQYATWAETHGLRFFVMYGQTEATARMAYLPPEVAATHPDSIGVPIPGGEFHLVDAKGLEITAADSVGELVYRGPNVMMGYATSPADLASGPELTELRTGDLASRDASGFYRISGRISRFAKIYGLRIALEEVEAKIAALGAPGIAVSDDEVLYVSYTSSVDPRQIVKKLAAAYKLPETSIHASRCSDIPTFESGKIDYRAALNAAQADLISKQDASGDAIEAAFRRLFPRAEITPDDSFVTLGGDSLNYVALSLELEKTLGHLPIKWEQISVRDLQGISTINTPLHWWSRRTIETEIIIRALAVIAVVIAHSSDLVVGGGADVLLMLVGYNLSRYQKPRLSAGNGFKLVQSFFNRIIAPYYILLVSYLAAKRELDVPSLLLFSNFYGRFQSLIEPFWFLEAMLQCLIIICTISLIRPIRNLVAKDPWKYGVMLLSGALLLKVSSFAIFHHEHLANRTPDSVLYLIAIGWCANEATNQNRRIILTSAMLALALVAYVGIPDAWPAYRDPARISHAVWMIASAIGLLWIRRVSIPRIAHACISSVAGASFYIYLTHVIPLYLFYWYFGIQNVAFSVAAAVSVGILVWWSIERTESLRTRSARQLARLLRP